MKLVYKKIAGIATDLRREDDGYVLKAGEQTTTTPDGELPDIETLHDPAKKKERDDKRKQILTLEDVISVLSAQQQAQLNAIKNAK